MFLKCIEIDKLLTLDCVIQSLCFDRQDNGLQQQNQNQHDGIQQHEQHEPYATCQNRKW